MAGQVAQAFTLDGIFFSPTEVTNYDQARAGDTAAYAQFFHAMLSSGIYIAPSAFETMFVSLAHTDDEIDQIVAAAHGACELIN